MNTIKNVSIEKVIKYIETHIHESMDIEQLAKVAGYSPYHFSRIFKQETGENIAAMIKRLKLACGVKQLLNLDMPITEVGQETGYETPSSFNKVFKQTFGCSPSEYRKHRQHNLQEAKAKLNGTPEIIKLNEKFILCYRVLGEYGDAAYMSWKTLITYLSINQKELASSLFSSELERYGICYDLPNITQEHMMRYEACVVTPKKLENLPQGFYIKTIPKGRYAKYRYEGSYNDLYEVSPRFYGWVQAQNESLTHFPLLERYCDDINLIMKQEVETPVTELYLQLK
ncbi:MAG: AraC family transcriptional regulator [Epsilonproteobacteria bacterium]|nr:AraC family transcriptional regulator [Campylobacterota bacterium]